MKLWDGFEHESWTWMTKFCWQREFKTAKEAFVILAIDTMLGLGLSRGVPGRTSPCSADPWASPRARAS